MRLAYNLIMALSSDARIGRWPEICGGKTCIAGHRVRVSDVVVWHEHEGMTPDEIVSQYPSISLGDVHSALAYYFDHIEEIQQEMRAERAFAQEFRRNNPSMLEGKLREEHLEEASQRISRRACGDTTTTRKSMRRHECRRKASYARRRAG